VVDVTGTSLNNATICKVQEVIDESIAKNAKSIFFIKQQAVSTEIV